MLPVALPLIYAIFVWWAATGCILYLDGLPQRTFGASVCIATLALGPTLSAVHWAAHEPTVLGAFVAFSAAILVWGWMELTFLTGTITGPRRTACAEGCSGHRHAIHAVEVILYHEFAIIAGAAVIAALTWGAPNQVAIQTFVVLWVMRTSAKLNLHLGVRNLGDAFLPDHLQYLKSFLRRRRMNVLFPLSVVLGTVVMVQIAGQAAAAGATPFEAAGATLVATLLGLAVLEHGFMMLPLPTERLWQWGFRSRTEPVPAPVLQESP